MRLWKKFNGEPFMINPQIGILGLGLNPRKRKKGKKTMARRSARARMAYARSFQKNRRHRRRSYRRNPYPVAGVALNPRHRRRHRRNPAVQNRRRYRRNPGGRKVFGLSLPPLQSVLYAGVGFVAVPVTEGFLNQFLPLSITSTTLGKYAIRIGSVIGLTWLGKMILGKQAALMVGIGGGAYVLVTAVKEFAPGMIPGLSAYTPLGAYTPSSGRNYRTLGAPSQQAFAQVLPFQASQQATASRFRRF
jgi:hypothetical protein